ncbi:hypothetical protein [Ensifer sp. LC163]|uniref:hypothetical protein n=1 Tax=Ensifer sp. LC163 TaxID=1120652 RepID=UPI001374734F|nr:hypothetical protein [Ensifer sp. LC163]
MEWRPLAPDDGGEIWDRRGFGESTGRGRDPGGDQGAVEIERMMSLVEPLVTCRATSGNFRPMQEGNAGNTPVVAG